MREAAFVFVVLTFQLITFDGIIPLKKGIPALMLLHAINRRDFDIELKWTSDGFHAQDGFGEWNQGR
jgi:hypothetical protein